MFCQIGGATQFLEITLVGSLCLIFCLDDCMWVMFWKFFERFLDHL